MSRENAPKSQRLVAVLWPSFLVSGVATVLVFVMFDPRPLLANTDWAELSRLGAYSIGFFWFWLITAASSWLTCYFQRPPSSLNRPQSTRE